MQVYPQSQRRQPSQAESDKWERDCRDEFYNTHILPEAEREIREYMEQEKKQDQQQQSQKPSGLRANRATNTNPFFVASSDLRQTKQNRKGSWLVPTTFR